MKLEKKLPLHAVLLHGLNNPPELMEPIAKELAVRGISTSVGKLTGHWEADARLMSLRKATAELWLSDAQTFFEEAQRAHPDKNLIFVGFSLGALLGLRLAQVKRVDFHRLILLAPPIALHPWSYFPKYVPLLNFILPSAMPRTSRANRGTPVAAYRSLFKLIAQTQSRQPLPRTLMILNPRD